jgi:hypothetical protein
MGCVQKTGEVGKATPVLKPSLDGAPGREKRTQSLPSGRFAPVGGWLSAVCGWRIAGAHRASHFLDSLQTAIAARPMRAEQNSFAIARPRFLGQTKFRRAEIRKQPAINHNAFEVDTPSDYRLRPASEVPATVPRACGGNRARRRRPCRRPAGGYTVRSARRARRVPAAWAETARQFGPWPRRAVVSGELRRRAIRATPLPGSSFPFRLSPFAVSFRPAPFALRLWPGGKRQPRRSVGGQSVSEPTRGVIASGGGGEALSKIVRARALW